MTDTKQLAAGNHGEGIHDVGGTNQALHFAQRGTELDQATPADEISGFDGDRMRARSLLTAAEEKKLMRKIDWRIMSLCSLLFLIKNIDADNISNARIMNKGTPMNIMTQLKMTSDEYNLLTVLYYVSQYVPKGTHKSNITIGPVYCLRGTIKPSSQKNEAEYMAITDHDLVGNNAALPYTCEE